MPEPNALDTSVGNKDALFPKFITSPGLTEGWKVKGHFHNGHFDGRIYPVLEDAFVAADFLQGRLTARIRRKGRVGGTLFFPRNDHKGNCPITLNRQSNRTRVYLADA